MRKLPDPKPILQLRWEGFVDFFLYKIFPFQGIIFSILILRANPKVPGSQDVLRNFYLFVLLYDFVYAWILHRYYQKDGLATCVSNLLLKLNFRIIHSSVYYFLILFLCMAPFRVLALFFIFARPVNEVFLLFFTAIFFVSTWQCCKTRSWFKIHKYLKTNFKDSEFY